MICDTHQNDMIFTGGHWLCPHCLAEASRPVIESMGKVNLRLRSSVNERRLQSSGIPPLFMTATFDSFTSVTKRAGLLRDKLKMYVDHFESQREVRGGFLFLGLEGRGKTHLACAMALLLIEHGFTARYTSLTELTRRIKSTYAKISSENVNSIVSDLVNADLLILDEIDLHGTSDTDYQILYDIINGRYEKGKNPTIAISNRDFEQITKDLNGRIISRILSGAPPIEFDWGSMRGKQVLEKN